MEALIIEVTNGIIEAYKNGGVIAAFATLLFFSVRIYRIDYIQNKLHPTARWSALPQWAKYMIPFLAAALGSLMMSLLGGMGAAAAVSAALAAGLGSIGLHEGTKKIGQAESKLRQLDNNYKPSPFRRVASAIVPIDKKLQAPVISAKK